MQMTNTAVALDATLPGNAIIHYQFAPTELIAQTLLRNEGVLNDTGALCINTSKFTGRSPKDKFIVKDAITADTVDWGKFNTMNAFCT